MSNKCNSEVDTFSLIKKTTDDNIAATSNLKYEHEVKLSSVSGPTSINYSLLVEQMEGWLEHLNQIICQRIVII